MKGVSLFSDLFTLFILLILVIIMCALIWIFTEIYAVTSSTGLVHPREVNVRILYDPIKYDSVLLTFLELRYHGIPMKKILNAVAIQNTKNPWMPEIPDFVQADQASKSIFDQLMPGKAYLLKIRDPEIIIASAGSISYMQKTSTELFLLNGRPVDLELYVG